MNEIIFMLLIPSGFGLTAALMTLARRWGNLDRSAGIGIAGWGLVGTFVLSAIMISKYCTITF